ncbi:hypothetical protein [Pseudarthrobacter sulfonivorans]|uniref:hypothetical protein n=1 Tax=Pseudarthrobacter sulfonivorans TaxID=121292 RepID=UPI002866AC96|nr:hypothetical protein [Pseudarthrobacter sulfonivorans]MDR6413416.1 hypothetical protein [Pseudarthrobacter sulfonivorans]
MTPWRLGSAILESARRVVPTLAPSPAPLGQGSAVRPFAIYYGWPSYVNGANGKVGKAVGAFEGYGVVVFGDDSATSEGDPLTAPIMAGVAARGGEPYGYVTVGVSDGEPNHSLDELRARLEAWRRLGARGVLLDCAGADYGVSRARFDAVVQYTHSLGMHVLANAWNPDDVLAGSRTMGPGDGYLGENDVLSDGRFLSPATYQPKLAKMAKYKAKLGITLYETSTSWDLQHADALTAQVLAALKDYPIDALQLSDPQYCCLDNVLISPPAALRTGQ